MTKIKVEKLVAAYNILTTAKYGKLSDEDKIKVWKIARALKPFADKFNEDTKDAYEKFKPTEDFDERSQKAQQYAIEIRKPKFDAEQLPMGPAEYAQFESEYNNYIKTVNKAMKDYAEKEVDVEFEAIGEEVLTKLMASNDWNIGQVTVAAEVICI